jgi:hypothetical protein
MEAFYEILNRIALEISHKALFTEKEIDALTGIKMQIGKM